MRRGLQRLKARNAKKRAVMKTQRSKTTGEKMACMPVADDRGHGTNPVLPDGNFGKMHGQPAKTKLADSREGNTNKMAAQFEHNRHGFGGFPGNAGRIFLAWASSPLLLTFNRIHNEGPS